VIRSVNPHVGRPGLLAEDKVIGNDVRQVKF
jgi:hypothetical protein